jgi:DNA-directed RNA polymerase
VEASEHESVLGESLTEEKEAFSTEWTAEEEEAFQQHPDKQRVTFKHWVPLQFPPLPERGTFNVANVKSSPYFFH